MTVKGGSWRDQEDEDNTKGSSPFKKSVPLEYGDDGGCWLWLWKAVAIVVCCARSGLASNVGFPGCRLPRRFFQLTHTCTPFCSRLPNRRLGALFHGPLDARYAITTTAPEGIWIDIADNLEFRQHSNEAAEGDENNKVSGLRLPFCLMLLPWTQSQ